MRGARGLQRLPFSKYKNVQKRQSRFTLVFDTAKNTHYVKKASNKICSGFNLVQKSHGTHTSIFYRSGGGAPKITISKIL